MFCKRFFILSFALYILIVYNNLVLNVSETKYVFIVILIINFSKL